MQLFTVLLATLYATLALATPLVTVPGSPSAKRSSGDGYKLVIYTDDYINSGTGGLPTANDLKGYNVLILAFLLNKGPADQAEAWKELSSSQRSQLLQDYNDAGITVMVSAFGSTETPTTDGVDAATIAKTHAAFVKQYDLAGIDVDYEDMGAMNKQNGDAENWLVTYTNTLRQQLPAGQYIITHAPVAPWFSTSAYKSGAYVTVNKEAGDNIDWYNIQFYNQGDTEYTTCNNLINTSGGDFPGTSVMEIHSKAGVDLNKIVIGKPSAAYQADNGFVDFTTLAQCIAEAGKQGWAAGTMFWEYESNLSNSLVTTMAKALAAIAGNGGGVPIISQKTTTTTKSSHSTTTASTTATVTSKVKGTTTTDAPATTTQTTSSAAPTTSTVSDPQDSCNGIKAWDANTVYDGGSEVTTGHEVSFNGDIWQNKWWTEGEQPNADDDSNPWEKVGTCSSSKRANVVAEELAANVTRSRRRMHNNKMRRVHVRPNDLS